MRILVVAVAAAAILGLASAETEFKKCATFGANSKFLCFKTVLDEVVVKMGNNKGDGTDDDVTLTVCDDLNNECCTTPPLDATASDDWSWKSTQTWKERYFGQCKGFVFTVKHGLVVTLSKKGTDNLVVSNITIDTKAPDTKKNKETERFLCGGFTLGATSGPESNRQTKLCKPGPYQFIRIFDADVQIGNDGTDDDVVVGVCASPNQGCCEKKLSGAFTDDWKKNKLEHWKTSYFGDCAKKLFKVNPEPSIYVKKTGKDDLVVDRFTMQFDVIDTEPKRIKFVCPKFSITGACKSASDCTRSLTNCVRSDVRVTGTKTATTARRPPPPARRPAGVPPAPARGSLRNRDLQIYNATVRIGADGTDDDVVLGICSDSKNDCCEKKLSKSFSDDWKKNKVENWKRSDFGDCSINGKTYRSTSAPKMYIKKNGKDDLIVSSFEIVFDVVGSTPATKIKFTCPGPQLRQPGYMLKGDCKKNPSSCRVDLTLCSQTGGVPALPSLRPAPVPPVRPPPPARRPAGVPPAPARGSLRNRDLQIYNATVKMGADGTDDDVTVGICSDSKNDCCEKKLSRTLSDDWKKNKVENWKKSKFGDCSKDGKIYRSTSVPSMYIFKNGKDDLIVSTFEIVFDIIGSAPAKQIRFTCTGPPATRGNLPGFRLTGDCKKNASGCRVDLTNCSPTEFAAPPKKKGGLFG